MRSSVATAAGEDFEVGFFELKERGPADATLAIAWHVKFAMDSTFRADVRGVRHTHAVLLEEDLYPAPDLLHLFEATAWLLEADDSLW